MSIGVSNETEPAQAGLYDGFVSYSHAADGLLAPRLQSGLQRFAKPWWKRRALRVFRDESSLSANPHLWSSITQALDDSSWFVLLLSPDAAASPWVNQEIEYWKTHKDPQRILPVLTGGTFEWASGDVVGTAVPEQLHGVFPEEPRWVDARFARNEDQLDLKNPNFADAVADIASALRGVPKDDLASEEVRQHRRTVRTAWAAGILVLLLGTAAAIAAVMASRNAQEAQRQATIAEENATEAQTQRDVAVAAEEEAQRQARLARMRELGSSAIEVLEDDPRLARILALEAVDVAGSTNDLPLSVVNALWRSLYEDRLVKEIRTGLPGITPIILSEDGTRLVFSSDDGKTLIVYSMPGAEEIWRFTDVEAEVFTIATISPDGDRVAIGVVNTDNPEGDVTRVMILDGNDGSVLEVFEYPDCPSIEAWGWSLDQTKFVLNNGIKPCPRTEASGGIWVELRDAVTWEPLAVIESEDPWVAEPIFDRGGNLFVFGLDSPVTRYEAPTYERSQVFEEAYGSGDISPDGSLLVNNSPRRTTGLRLVDTSTGRPVDTLSPLPGAPEFGIGMRFSGDGSSLVVASDVNETTVWDTSSGRRTYAVPTGPSTAAAISPDGEWLYTSHPDGVMRVWTLGPIYANATAVGDLGSHQWVNGNSFRYGPDGIASAQTIDILGDCIPFCSQIRLFDVETGVLLSDTTDGFGHQILPDGRLAFSNAGSDWYVYDLETGQTEPWVECVPNDTDGCSNWGDSRLDEVIVSVDSPEVALRLIAPDLTEALVVIDPVTGEPLQETPSQHLIRAFSKEWVLVDSGAGFLVLDRDSGEEIRAGKLSGTRFEMSPSGEKAAWITWEGELGVLDLADWTETTYELGLSQIRGIAFGPADRLIALGEEFGLRVVDLDEGFVTQTIPIPGISDIHWLDRDHALIGTKDGLWAVVSLDITDLIARARQPAVPREFTAQECVTYRIDPCPAEG